jgi:hypothetical protein
LPRRRRPGGDQARPHRTAPHRTAPRDATYKADELTKAGVALNLGGAVYDPTDPVGRLPVNVLAGLAAEFEADLI